MECGAKKRSGGTCKAPAMPNGRCRIHGGKSLIGKDSPTYKTGKYSRYALKDEDIKRNYVKFQEDADPLNVKDELSLLRAVLEVYLDKNLDLDASNVNQIRLLITDITKVVERVHDIRIKESISVSLFNEVTLELGRITRTVLEENVPDQHERIAATIAERWAGIAIDPKRDKWAIA